MMKYFDIFLWNILFVFFEEKKREKSLCG